MHRLMLSYSVRLPTAYILLFLFIIKQYSNEAVYIKFNMFLHRKYDCIIAVDDEDVKYSDEEELQTSLRNSTPGVEKEKKEMILVSLYSYGSILDNQSLLNEIQAFVS